MSGPLAERESEHRSTWLIPKISKKNPCKSSLRRSEFRPVALRTVRVGLKGLSLQLSQQTQYRTALWGQPNVAVPTAARSPHHKSGVLLSCS